jgi:hypothetical protein
MSFDEQPFCCDQKEIFCNCPVFDYFGQVSGRLEVWVSDRERNGSDHSCREFLDLFLRNGRSASCEWIEQIDPIDGDQHQEILMFALTMQSECAKLSFWQFNRLVLNAWTNAHHARECEALAHIRRVADLLVDQFSAN